MRTRLLAFLLCTATGLLLLGAPARADGHLNDLEQRLDRLEKHIDRLADHLHAAHAAHAGKATCDKQGGCDEGKRGKRCDKGDCAKRGGKAGCDKGDCGKRCDKGGCDKQATCDKGRCDKGACDKGGCDKGDCDKGDCGKRCDKGCCGSCGGDKARCSKGGCDKKATCDKARCDKGGCDKQATCDKGGCDKGERAMAPRVAATPARAAPIFQAVVADGARLAVARARAPRPGSVEAQIQRYEEMIRDAETDAAVSYFLARIETLRKQMVR